MGRTAGSQRGAGASVGGRSVGEGSGGQQRGSVRSNGNVTRGGLSTSRSRGGNVGGRGDIGRGGGNTASDFLRIESGHGRNVERIHPRERGFLSVNPGRFYDPQPHYFGYRVEFLPRRCRLVTYFGIEYRFYNGVYYRPWNNWWVICRPPFGVCIDAVDVVFDIVNFAYFNSSYRLYRAIDENNRYIDEQNRIIAQNNATIAAQNREIALNLSRADDSYSIADALGLVQSYAYADHDYYYQDGVFYIMNSRGQYEVIVPPAGALVTALPDDYEVISLGGENYYKVDDTVYRLTLVDGVPYLEVLGQMYGELASRYNSYK